MGRATTVNYLSQIVPLNKGVSVPTSWPITSGTYDDSSTLQSAFTNVSTNPRIITIDDGAFDTAGVKSINCYEIHNAPTATVNSNSVFEISNIDNVDGFGEVDTILNRLYPYDTTLESYLTVSASTRSNRISLEGQGALSNLISSSSLDTAFDYFVLIHADDAKKHHLAKITELHTYEVFGDGFDFTPAFNGDIPKDTKISIYKGPAANATHIVAVGYGLLGDGDDSDGRHDTYVEVSRPTFYFYEDRCEKNRLSANTKYRVIKNIAYEVSTALHLDFGKKMSGSASDTGTTPDFQKHGTSVCFLTTSDFGGYIVDKTGYTQFGELVDNLKNRDKTINTGTTTTTTIVSNITGDNSNWPSSAETSSANVSFGEWDKCFFNTMRDTHSTSTGVSSTTYDSAIKRIVTYENSDLKNYHLPHIQYIDLFDSVASVGNFMEMKFPDANKILNLKLKNFDNVLVKKEINSEDYSGAMNVQLPGVVSSSTTGWSLTFSKLNVEQDFRDIWGSSLIASENTNKLRVGDFIFAGDFSAPTIGSDGYEQIFAITHYRNIRTDYTWTTASSNWSLDAIENGNAFVYPFMNKEGVIVAGFDIDTEYDGANIKRNGNTISGVDNFISNTEVLVRDKELTGFTFDLNYGDKNLNYVKPKTTTYDGYQIRTRIRGTASRNTVPNIPELYSYINGDILHLDKVFDGYIESIKSNIQGGIVSYDISGRDYTNRLLDSVVNKDFTHTKDYIFTTVSPEADMNTQSGTVYIQDFDMGSTTIVISSNSTSTILTREFEVGDVIYCTLKSQTKLLGIVSAIANKIGGSGGFTLGTYWDTTLNQHVAFTSNARAIEITLTEPTIYSSYNQQYGATNLKYSRKATSLGKALSANKSDSIFPTTLTGCSNKGIVYKSGEKINISTGAYISDLIEESANESKFSIGYPMSKIEGEKDNTNFADYRFSISSDAAETTITQNDTISSPTEFAIANRQTLENNQSLLTLAPIFPVILAKSSSNTSDTRISNGNGLYFQNTQGLSSGGFLHLLNSETNSQGASITFSNPGYKDFSSNTDGLDYRFEDNYGAFIWRYTGLQKGSLFWDAEYLDKVWDVKKKDIFYAVTTDSGWQNNYMYGINTAITGYAIAQRINYDGIGVNFGTENDFTNHYQKLGSPESRDGFYPIIGSRFWDIDKMSDTLKEDVLRYKELGGSETFERRDNRLRSHYPQLSRRNGNILVSYASSAAKARQSFESFDRNTENFYLFSTGDIFPDSYKRSNSIGFTNRDLQKYSLIVKNTGSESTTTVNHENYLGSLNNTLLNDASFETIPIQSSNVNTSELKRFGLVRLIEATYDFHFNEIDYENLPTNVIAPASSYVKNAVLGGLVEHETDLIDTSRTDGGEPEVQDFGVEYIASATTDSVGSEGYAYYKMSLGPRTGASANYVAKQIFTDFETFNTGSTNIFGDYNPESLAILLRKNPHNNTEDKTWVTISGIMNSIPISRIQSGGTDAGRTPGTYNNVSVTDGSVGDGNLRLTVVVGVGGVVTSMTPYEYASSITGEVVKHRGSGYDEDHPFTIAGADIGGGADVVVDFVESSDQITEHRLYLLGNTPFTTNITGTTTKVKDYTGRVKVSPDNIRDVLDNVPLTTNDGSYKNALSNDISYTPNTGPRLMNLGFLIGATDDTTKTNVKHDGQYLGSSELAETPPTLAGHASHAQQGYDLILPIYFDDDGIRSPTGKQYLFNSTLLNAIQGSTKDYSATFELSRVFNELAQWDEPTIVGSSYTATPGTSNPIGVGPSHLYTDTISVIKDMHFDTHTKIEYKNSVNGFQVDLTKYSGATIPNLHISFIEGDYYRKFISIKYATEFTDNSKWTNNTPEHTGSGMPSTVGSFGLFDTDRQGFTQDVDNMVGLEMYFKMVLNITSPNVSVLDLDGVLQQTNIPGNVSVKANVALNGRALIKITTPDITTDANNGKNGSGGSAGFAKNNVWINFVNDLTGYYLVSEPSNRIPNKTTPNKIHKIVSHTINTTGATITHFLEIDNVEYSGNIAQPADYYRLMRIAKDCTFDFTPNEISVLELNNVYTKIPNRNECYTVISSYNSAPINGGVNNKADVTNEAVLSMYAFLDVDGTGETNKKRYVLRRERQAMITTDGANNTFTSGNTERMLMTDGNKDRLENVSFTIFNNKDLITISNMHNMKGVVSFGKVFNITTFNSLKSFGSDRCNLASTVDVVEEVDEIVNHILEDNNVQFETNYDTTNDMYFIGPNYTGASGFHVINDLLGLKNKRFLVNGETIEGRDLLSDNLYTNIVLSENDESEGVVNLRIDTSSYDFYNEVIVYGDNARGVARNNRSIRDLGRKITLEITDLSLQTSKAAQDKANKELEIVEILSSQVSFNVSKTRIPYLRAGQVITLDYPSLDVQTGFYQVLEIEDNFGQLPRITVGKYTQSLASRFADLSLKTREIQGVQRGNRFQEGNTIVQEAVIPEIKPLNLKVIKTGTAGSLLGFTNTLGFSSELGFETSSSLTEEVILNKDLTE